MWLSSASRSPESHRRHEKVITDAHQHTSRYLVPPRPPSPHHFVCVEKFTLPYLTSRYLALAEAHPPEEFSVVPWKVWTGRSERSMPRLAEVCA